MRGYHCHQATDWLNEIAVGAAVCVGSVIGAALFVAIVSVIIDLFI